MGKDLKCMLCGNKNFEVPEDIINAIKNENLVLFAGSGVSTEGKGVFPRTLYSIIKDELNIDYDISFSDLMSLYCEKPNGRRKLITKILDRFEYYKSFNEVDNVMRPFYETLANIYSIKEIITTNWDRQFEEKCGCIPVTYNQDISLLDDNKRRVYKIHGTIDNISSLVITKEDYKACYRRLSKNLLGAEVKRLLSNKTVLFIGYSLEDEDFKEMWKYINKLLGNLKPHFYIVTPDERINDRFTDKNVSVINTTGREFIDKVYNKLVEDKFLYDDVELYGLVGFLLSKAQDEHRVLSKLNFNKGNELLVYSLFFQDGLIHSLERVLNRESYGEYLDPRFLPESIDGYYIQAEKYLKEGPVVEAAYAFGYMSGMKTIHELYISKDYKNMYKYLPLYYLPRKRVYYKLKEIKKDIKDYKVKKYIKIAKKIVGDSVDYDNEIIAHHPPFLW